jgi:predicted O-methyltransferase YrrM
MTKVNTKTIYQHTGATQWYEPVQVSSANLLSLAKSSQTIKKTLATLKRLSPDDYLEYIIGYYRAGLKKFKKTWEYSDLLTHLQAASQLLQPQHYLEIGVRRGRSLAVIARECPNVNIFGFDLWVQNYAGMENPGPEFVSQELKKLGHKGHLKLISGDSSKTVPEFLKNNDMYFDVITVDGDHSEEGARTDLENTLPRLKVGGVLLLDDITHPEHRYLETLWDEMITKNNKFTSAKYTELGYGIACAIRREF